MDDGIHRRRNMHVLVLNNRQVTKWDISCAGLVKQLKGNDEQGIWGTQDRFKGQELLERDQSVWTKKYIEKKSKNYIRLKN